MAARRLIEDGLVEVAGVPEPKPATQVTPEASIRVTDGGPRWASRGGAKLAGALDRIAVTVSGRRALDAGAAHGGFTDVLLARGAAHVIAVDVAYGQLDWRLRNDPRVTVLERTNVRTLKPHDVPGPPPALVVADLSFIGLARVLPALVRCASADADLIPLVKPQFEAGPTRVGKGGVVRDPRVWADVLASVAAEAAALGRPVRAVVASPLPGPAGNVEFFVHCAAGEPAADLSARITAACDEGARLRAAARSS